MTILVGFSASRQSDAPINLATRIARNTGEAVLAAAVVERPWPPKGDPVEDEYLRYVTAQAQQSLDRVIKQARGDLDIPAVVHQSTSIPTGLLELAAENEATLVVVGSSSSGLLGRVALGSVTDRLVHTAAVPVAIAPRGYPLSPEPLSRITAAYGGEADITGLLAAVAELAKAWSVPVRIVSFTVRPAGSFGATIESSAEELVIAQWAKRMHEEIVTQLDKIRSHIVVPHLDIVVGSGSDWGEAVENVAWEPGDILALGSGAAGEISRVFLGSAASRIVRHSPVPVMIVPRHE
jgi:nucleotide-binding universal stress UspA family protein